MAKTTQLTPSALPGRAYGDFDNKAVTVAPAPAVERGRRYGPKIPFDSTTRWVRREA